MSWGLHFYEQHEVPNFLKDKVDPKVNAPELAVEVGGSDISVDLACSQSNRKSVVDWGMKPPPSE